MAVAVSVVVTNGRTSWVSTELATFGCQMFANRFMHTLFWLCFV